MTSSKPPSERDPTSWVDGLPEPTPEDREALRRARRPVAMSAEEYRAFLRSLPAPTREQLLARGVTTGEPFRL